MIKKVAFFTIILIFISTYYLNFISKKKNNEPILNEDENYNTNLLENLKYVAKDKDGNEYIITARRRRSQL